MGLARAGSWRPSDCYSAYATFDRRWIGSPARRASWSPAAGPETASRSACGWGSCSPTPSSTALPCRRGARCRTRQPTDRGRHGHRTDGGVQRRGDRDHHHNHGVRAEGAARHRPGRAGRPAAGARQLRAELRYVAIYWNNHHHLLHACDRINGAIMWANMHFLFWLSLIPFVTSWVGDHRESPVPAAAYGVVLLMAGVAYLVMERQMVRENGPQSVLAEAVGRDRKGLVSLIGMSRRSRSPSYRRGSRT